MRIPGPSSGWREHQVLERTGADLAAGDPRLAAMLAMFTRLTAAEGLPPDENLITSRRRTARARRGRAHATPVMRITTRRAPGPLWLAIVPALILTLVAITMALGLSSTFKCASQISQPGLPGHDVARRAGASCPANPRR
jgi:hypothetical protein